MMKYSLSFRIWHWLNAVVVLGLLGTVFLRKTFLSWRDNAEILSLKLSSMEILINADQAKVLAKSIRAPMWEWHILLGYALAFLTLYRVVLFFKDSSDKECFSVLSIHKKLVHLMYYSLYALLIFMSVSGLVIHFYELLGLTKSFAHDIKEIHELLYIAILVFTPLHIAGVFVAENRDEKGIVSSMINGRK